MGRRQLLDDELGDRRQVDQSLSKRVGRPDLALRGSPPWASHNGPHSGAQDGLQPSPGPAVEILLSLDVAVGGRAATRAF